MSKPKHYSLSKKDNWQTPAAVTDMIERGVGEIHLDPCAGEDTSIGETNYRLEDDQDGLVMPWFGTVFVNPPFSYKKEWLEKVREELEIGNTDLIVVLTPDGTDTISWWHEYVAEDSDYICFKESRLNYVNPDPGGDDPGATFGTAMSLYGEVPDALLKELTDWGHLVETVTGDDL